MNVKNVLVKSNINQFTERMKFCLRTMHIMGLVHKDIKPQNIMYSPSVGDYVFIDFGITDYIV